MTQPTNQHTSQVRRAKLGVVISLFLMIIGLIAASYFYFQLQEREQRLEQTNLQLEVAQDSLIVLEELLVDYRDSMANALTWLNKKYVGKDNERVYDQIQQLVKKSKNLEPGIIDHGTK